MRKVGGGTPHARDEARSLSQSESVTLALSNSDVTPIDGPSTGNAKEASPVEIALHAEAPRAET